MTDIKYWIWLSLCVPPGSKAGDLLLLSFSADAKAIYDAGEEAFENLEGIDKSVIQALLNKDLSEAEEILEYCAVNNIGLLPYNSDLYPSRLRRIERAPILLYYRGQLIDFDKNVGIAAVGTRSYTEYGRREAYRICRDLALGGAIIISGMARGIDGFCHRGALDVQAHTVAVLGCGINKVYPPEHEELMNEIIRNGTVISEYRPFTDPIGSNFPLRNRIISGLALGTLVIEANQRSGALITARYALKQGRDIFALPGKVGDANSQGTNELIQKGAKMVQNAEDILGEYEFYYPNLISIEKLPKFNRFHLNPFRRKAPIAKKSDDAEKSAQKKKSRGGIAEDTGEAAASGPEPNIGKTVSETDYSSYNLSSEQLQILTGMEPGNPTLPDELAKQGIPVSKILSGLTMLEIKGLVEKIPGGKFVRLK